MIWLPKHSVIPNLNCEHCLRCDFVASCSTFVALYNFTFALQRKATNVFRLPVLLEINSQYLSSTFHSLLSPRCSRISTYEHFPSSLRILAQPKFTMNLRTIKSPTPRWQQHSRTGNRGNELILWSLYKLLYHWNSGKYIELVGLLS